MRKNVSDLELVQVAHIVKSYNTTGNVIIRYTTGLLEELNISEPVFIYFDNLPVPFFISSISKKGSSGAVVKFESINDLSHAEDLVQKGIYVPTTSIDQESINDDIDNLRAFLSGCKIYNQNGDIIGNILDYHNYPNNPCIEVDLIKKNTPQQESILIPFNEDLILEFNPSERFLKMEIPNGLLEL